MYSRMSKANNDCGDSMENRYVFAHDVGTSSVKTTLVNAAGNILGYAIEEYPIYYPQPGWVEQEPEDYWKAIIKGTKKVLEEVKVKPEQISGIVFTTQAMGIIPIDERGKALYRNITWVDGRAEKQARKIMRLFGGKKVFKSIIGIEITGKDVVCKLLWLKKERPELYMKTALFLDVNGYLKYKATGEKVTEWSGACSYSFNLKKKDWDKPIFRLIGIDLNKLPPLVRSIDSIGKGLTKSAAEEMGLIEGIPVFGGCDDTQSALVGSTAIDEGEAHVYLGTSAWLGVSTKKALKFKHGAVTLQGADPEKNIVVGVTESAGIILEWASKELYKAKNLDPNEDEVFHLMDQEIASVLPGSDHLIITPWVLGERCPISTTTTRGTIFNISLEHTRAHFIRAIDEGIAYNIRWMMENFEKDFGFKFPSIKVIGGGSQSEVWCQIIADVTKRTVETINRPKFAGAIGAAMIAFVGLGIYSNFDQVKNIVQIKKNYEPNPSNFIIYDDMYQTYHCIYNSLKKTYQQINKKRFEKI